MTADAHAVGRDGRIHEELCKLEEDVLYTEKTHFAAAEALGRVHLALGLVATAASAATATTLLGEAPTWVSGLLALVATLASGVLTFLKPDKRSSQHLQAGRSFGRLRVRMRQARLVELSTGSPLDYDDWTVTLSQMADLKAEIEDSAAATAEWMFRWARRKIERGDFEHAS